MTPECYIEKIRLQRESELDTSHDFEVTEFSIVSNEPQRAKSYTQVFKQEREK